MPRQSLQVAEEGLSHWLHGVATNNWQNFLTLLTRDYPVTLPSIRQTDSLRSDVHLHDPQFVAELRKLTVRHVVRVTTNQQTVVFELEGAHNRICVSLSFDVRDEKIAACREYYCC